jgi:hypothetical protein
MIPASEKVRQIGPHSRPHRLLKLDGRTREATLLREARDQLIEHVGGAPSAVQLRLIERAALLTLHVAMFDARALAGNGLSERDGRQYLAYSNSLARALAQLGLKPSVAPVPTLAEVLAAGRAGAAA